MHDRRPVLGVLVALLLVAASAASVLAAASDSQSAEIEGLMAKVRALRAVMKGQSEQIEKLRQENVRLRAENKRLRKVIEKAGLTVPPTIALKQPGGERVLSLETVLGTIPYDRIGVMIRDNDGSLNTACQVHWCGLRVRTTVDVMQVVKTTDGAMLVGSMPSALVIHGKRYGCVVYAKFLSAEAIRGVNKGARVTLVGVIKGCGTGGWLYRGGTSSSSSFTWQPLLRDCHLVSPTASELDKAASVPSNTGIDGPRLTEAQRKQVFWEIAKIEDAAFDFKSYDPKEEDRRKDALARKWGLTEGQLSAIAVEGVKKKWPIPPAPKP